MPTIVLNKSTTNPAIPKVPVRGFTDDFNRPNASTLGSTPAGKGWEILGSAGNTWQIIGNAAGGLSLSGVASYPVVDAQASDGIYRVTVGEVSLAAGGLSLRVKDGSNMLRLAFRVSNGNNTIRLEQFDDGVMTPLATSPGPVLKAGMRHVIDVILDGTLISVKIDGVLQIAPVRVTKYATETKFGFYGVPNDAGIRYDAVEFIPA